jgi:hypothetical protein
MVAVAILAELLRGAGSVAAWVSGLPQPTDGIEAGFSVLVNPGKPGAALGAPGLSAVGYWITAAVLIVLVGTAGWWVWRLLREHGRQAKNNPYRIAGIATRAEVANAASGKALRPPREILASLVAETAGRGCRLPDRRLTRRRRMGVGGGLDPAYWPAPLRQRRPQPRGS